MNYYKILGISQAASKEDINAKHKELAKMYHPDINNSEDAHERMTMLNEANEVLSDRTKREEYDKALNLSYRQTYDREISQPQTVRAEGTRGTRDAEIRAEKAEMLRRKTEVRLKTAEATQIRRKERAQKRAEESTIKKKQYRVDLDKQHVLNVLSGLVMDGNAQRKKNIEIDDERHDATEVLLSLVRKDDKRLLRMAEEADLRERKQRVEEILALVKEYNEEPDEWV